MRRLGVELAQDRHAVFHFVALDLLRRHKLDTVLVYLAAELLEHIRLVVLTAKAHHEDCTCVRVMNHIAEDLLRVLVVVAELRAAVVMRESEDIVRAGLLTQTLCTFLDDTVHATYGRDDPHFVADTYLSVFAAVPHERTSFVGDIEHHILRMILVAEQACEVGLDIVLVHPTAGFLRLACMTDGETVLDDVLAFGQVFDGYLMSGRHVLKDCYLLAVHLNNRTCGLRLYCYYHIVRRVDFQNIRHKNKE